MLLGTQRLQIVDRERAVQPWTSADGAWALCYNGEVFNYRELRTELQGLGHQLRSSSDTEVVLESFLEWGEEAVHHFRGEFAFAAVERSTGRVYLARDPVGVKPLYWSEQGGRLHIASEVKSLVPVGAAVTEVPPGHHGWGAPGSAPRLAPYVDLMRLGEDEDPIEDPDEAMKLVRAALEDSIRVRVDTDLTVGVILSGGVDSASTLIHVQAMHPDCVAFTVGTADSDDLHYVRRLTSKLGVQHEVIESGPRRAPLRRRPDGHRHVGADRVRRHHREHAGVRRLSSGFRSLRREGGALRGRLRRALRRVRHVRRRGRPAPATVPAQDPQPRAAPSCSGSTGPAWGTASRPACRSWTSPWSDWPCACPSA